MKVRVVPNTVVYDEDGVLRYPAHPFSCDLEHAKKLGDSVVILESAAKVKKREKDALDADLKAVSAPANKKLAPQANK